MCTGDGNLVIVYNGEIYNFRELRAELERTRGCRFRTNTDTEVLLNLYKEFGHNMLDKVNGMFAFAIHDNQKGELFLARDRMGKKPLFYAQTADTFIFASELKALLKHPSCPRLINVDGLNQYLTFDYVPVPNSIIENVQKLEPAHYMVIKDNKIHKKEPYWRHNFTTDKSISFEESKQRLETLLDSATRSRLISDVPLGTFLSGGLDSTTVTYFAQKNSMNKIQTFSIGFEDQSYDESTFATKAALHLGTDHYPEVLTARATFELIYEVYPMVDEPFADASLIPTYFLSKHARKNVTVALGGDGSDELLAGYPTFISEYFRHTFSLLPESVNATFLRLAETLLPVSDKNISFDFKMKQFLRGFSVSNPHYTHQLWLGSFLPVEKQQLFSHSVFAKLRDKSGLAIIDDYFNNSGAKDDYHKLVYYYYQTYLVDDILAKVDRASMYNSLEVRAPFLDKDVVEFLNTLPASFKQKGLTGKYILKKLMEDKLPAEIVHRPKKGFGIPLSSWLRNELKDHLHLLLSKEMSEHFELAYIENLLRQHHSKKRNHRKLIWNLFMFALWRKENKI
jgi:asparagine synthase (glutamine-hydrolysing)